MLKSPKIKKIVIFAFILVVIVSIIVGVILVRQRQNLVNEASVPSGEARISMLPASGTYQVGQAIPVTVSFSSGSIAISAIAMRISYSYSGTNPELVASDLQVNTALLSSGDWSCPVKTITPLNGKVQIDLACVNLSTSGYIAPNDTALATFSLNASQIPAINPTVLTFDPVQSIITKKTDAQDTLLTPSSTASFTIVSAAGSASPTPTVATVVSPTPTTAGVGINVPSSTPTPTSSQTATPTSSSNTVTPTPTSFTSGSSTNTATTVPVPVSGASTPTIIGIGIGLLFIMGAVVLAL